MKPQPAVPTLDSSSYAAIVPGNRLRHSARCERCGAKGAILLHPSYGGTGVAWEPFPTTYGEFDHMSDEDLREFITNEAKALGITAASTKGRGNGAKH